jgi:hypothetical protein
VTHPNFRAAKSIRTCPSSSLLLSSSPYHLHSRFTTTRLSRKRLSLTATEHGCTDSTLRAPRSSRFPSRPLCAGTADDGPRRPPCTHLETFIARARVLNIFSTLSIFLFSFITFHSQAAGLDPAHYHRRRHSRRQAEYILRRSLT